MPPIVNMSVGTIKGHNLCSCFFMLLIISCLSTPRFCSLSITSRHKPVKQPRDTTLHQETIETGQETLLRHQETACVQGEPQAKRHYSVIRRRPVSRESHRPRDITPSSGDGLCPGRATGQETLLRHQETACVQGEPQAISMSFKTLNRPFSKSTPSFNATLPTTKPGIVLNEHFYKKKQMNILNHCKAAIGDR